MTHKTLTLLGLLAVVLPIMGVPWPIAATGLALGVGLVGAWVTVIVLLLFGRRLTGVIERLAARHVEVTTTTSPGSISPRPAASNAASSPSNTRAGPE